RRDRHGAQNDSGGMDMYACPCLPRHDQHGPEYMPMPHIRRQASCAHTASPTCVVLAVPPRSRVWFFGSATTAAHACWIALAAFGWLRKSSIIATLRNVAIGLAKFLPAMSGAEPWTGSNMLAVLRVGFRFPLA